MTRIVHITWIRLVRLPANEWSACISRLADASLPSSSCSRFHTKRQWIHFVIKTTTIFIKAKRGDSSSDTITITHESDVCTVRAILFLIFHFARELWRAMTSRLALLRYYLSRSDCVRNSPQATSAWTKSEQIYERWQRDRRQRKCIAQRQRQNRKNAGASVCVIYYFIHSFACRWVRSARRADAIMQRFFSFSFPSGARLSIVWTHCISRAKWVGCRLESVQSAGFSNDKHEHTERLAACIHYDLSDGFCCCYCRCCCCVCIVHNEIICATLANIKNVSFFFFQEPRNE